DKGKKINSELNEFIAKMNENGGTQKLADKWFSGTKPTEFVDYESLTGENGTIQVGMSDTDPPLSYQDDNGLTGFDLEYIILFAREYGYKLEISTVDFSFILGSVQSGKCDLAIGGITVTEERKEVLNFTDTYYESPVVMVTKGYDSGKTYLADLSGKKIGVMTGSIQAVMMPELIPDATYMEFNSVSDLIVALNSKKIDAFGCDESLYTSMLWEGQAVDRIDEPLGESNYGMIFPKGKKLELQSEINEYIAKVNADGTLEALEEKWFGAQEPTEFESYDNLNGTKGTITVAVSSSSMPFVYLKNNKFTGFDIEFIIAFAKEYGYDIKFVDTAFAAILGGVQSEKYDLGMSGITITEERKESMDFSDVYHVEDLAVIIRSEEGSDALAQFNTASLGVVTGSLYGGYSREQFPNAKIKEFNNFSDVLVALKQGKVDGIMLDKPNFNSVARTDKNLSCITVPAYSVEIGFGFQKNDGGDALQAQMNEFLAKLDADGTTGKLIDKWYGETEPEETVPLENLATNEKTLNVSIDTTRKPFVYMYEGKPVGFEIEVLYMFCREYGFNVSISDISFASGLVGLSAEKYDLVCGG
ncbi:MAG: transporter substrate-binding domain-containing protein, partial [Clostridia bacterium]|nr:transporter substrate-binding domain-containing protein [Clostridia bacterium]